ncbi:MAG: hypothetical protein ACXVS6_22675 [Solirubrobacteraceae bacterium]
MRASRRRKAERRAEDHENAVTALSAQAVLDRVLAEPVLVARVAQAAQHNWRAAAWLLERRHPERWGRGAEPAPAFPGGDPFAEVDELAQRRRGRPRPAS